MRLILIQENKMEKKRYLVGGNWKSNGTVQFVSDIINNTLNKMKYDE